MNRKALLSVGVGAGAAMAVFALARRLPRYDFRGKVAVITGGSRGLGLVLARRLAAEGAHLVLLARDTEELERAAVELRGHGVDVMTHACDIRDRAAVDRAVTAIMQSLGRIDVLINNAGIIQVGPLENMTAEDFEDAMAVHVYGPLNLSLAIVPHMRRQGGGRIVNITSIGGKVAVPHMLPYTTSKFALVGLSDGLRAELRKDNIYVTTICPGLMRTGSPPNAFFKGQYQKEYAWFAIGDALPGLSLPVDRAARRILNACRRGAPRLVIGLPAKIAVLANELLPGISADITALVNRFLPQPDPQHSTDIHSGWESQSQLAPSVLTTLSDRATRRNNETPDGRRMGNGEQQGE